MRGAAPLGLHEHVGLRQHAPAPRRRPHRNSARPRRRRLRCRRRAPRSAHAPAANARRPHAAPSAARSACASPRRRRARSRGRFVCSSAALLMGAVIAANRPGERWKAGTARANYGENRRILLRFFNSSDSPEPGRHDGGTPHAAHPLRRLDRTCDRGRADRGLAARTETGVRRIATLISPAAARGRAQREGSCSSPTAPFDQEAEQRRLSEAIRMLAADRDRLLARVNTLERSVEDVTGSIAARRQPAATPCRRSRHAPHAGAAPPGRLRRRSSAGAPARAASRPATSRPAARRRRSRSRPRPSSGSTSAQCHDRWPARAVDEP